MDGVVAGTTSRRVFVSHKRTPDGGVDEPVAWLVRELERYVRVVWDERDLPSGASLAEWQWGAMSDADFVVVAVTVRYTAAIGNRSTGIYGEGLWIRDGQLHEPERYVHVVLDGTGSVRSLLPPWATAFAARDLRGRDATIVARLAAPVAGFDAVPVPVLVRSEDHADDPDLVVASPDWDLVDVLIRELRGAGLLEGALEQLVQRFKLPNELADGDGPIVPRLTAVLGEDGSLPPPDGLATWLCRGAWLTGHRCREARGVLLDLPAVASVTTGLVPDRFRVDDRGIRRWEKAGASAGNAKPTSLGYPDVIVHPVEVRMVGTTHPAAVELLAAPWEQVKVRRSVRYPRRWLDGARPVGSGPGSLDVIGGSPPLLVPSNVTETRVVADFRPVDAPPWAVQVSASLDQEGRLRSGDLDLAFDQIELYVRRAGVQVFVLRIDGTAPPALRQAACLLSRDVPVVVLAPLSDVRGLEAFWARLAGRGVRPGVAWDTCRRLAVAAGEGAIPFLCFGDPPAEPL